MKRGVAVRGGRACLLRWAWLLISCSAAGCGSSGRGPTAPAPSSVPEVATERCPAFPGPEIVNLPRWPVANPAQDAACSGNVRPTFKNIVVARRDGGVEVEFATVDPDANAMCWAVYFNGRASGWGCGGGASGGVPRGVAGSGSSFSNFLTFPVEVRVVGWDDQGCLAEPVCVTVF